MDLVIINPPLTRLIPPIGPALIKSFVVSKGFSCKLLDWNFELWKIMSSESEEKMDNKYWDSVLVNLYDREDFHELWENKVKEISKTWIKEIQDLNPTWVGFSVNCNRTMGVFAIYLCQMIREKFPLIKLVIGGSSTTLFNEFSTSLLEEKIVDVYITGEGEYATVELLKGNYSYPGINNFNYVQIGDLNKNPFADYSDLDIPSYPGNYFLIMATRGCVRRCHFCSNYFKKYVSRDGVNIVDELVEIYNKYGIINFLLADATSNGNPPKFLSFVKTIIQYKKDGLLPHGMTWSAPFNCVSEKLIGEETYKLIKESNCVCLSPGIESGSEKIRFDMNKKIRDEDVDFFLKQCRKHKINVSICFIVGYYTETEEDFTKTLDLLTKYSSFTKDVDITISVVQGFGLQVGSYDYDNWKELGIKSFKSFNQWTYKDNTPEVRLERLTRFKEHALKMGYGMRIAKEKMLKRDL